MMSHCGCGPRGQRSRGQKAVGGSRGVGEDAQECLRY